MTDLPVISAVAMGVLGVALVVAVVELCFFWIQRAEDVG
jgi:hypothetical protein